jgi:hypothetical protein
MNHEDFENENSYHWMETALMFANAISFLLHESEGVVIEMKTEKGIEKFIVFVKNGDVNIAPCDEDYDSGQFVMITDINPN